MKYPDRLANNLTRCILDERDVTRAWQNLFKGKAITADSLVLAEELLDGLSGESPLHIRYANELAELKKMPALRKEARPKAKKTK